jgi:hypothetical protein
MEDAMSSTLIPACALRGPHFASRQLPGLHIREDHLQRHCHAEPGDDQSGDPGDPAGETGIAAVGARARRLDDPRCARRSVLLAARTATASRDLAAEPACLTRALTAPRCTMQSRGLAGPAPPDPEPAESFTACTAS